MLCDIENENIKELLFQGEFGLEMESLRVTADGELSQTPHPFEGDPNITRDFCENQTEMITDVFDNIDGVLDHLDRLQHTVRDQLDEKGERLWRFSNPPAFSSPDNIPIADFKGSVYRDYLAAKYGKVKMLLSGIHLNYSLPRNVISLLAAETGKSEREFKDRTYLSLAAGLLSYSWLIVYLTAASPVLDESFVRFSDLPDSAKDKYSSVRCSEIGYWNFFTPVLDYSSLDAYCDSIGRYIENGDIISCSELYYPLRVKPRGKYDLDLLREHGINHVELRMIDLDPLAPLGVFKEDLEFIHLLILYILNNVHSLPEVSSHDAVHNMKQAALFSRDTPVKVGGRDIPVNDAAAAAIETLGEFAREHYPCYLDAVKYQLCKTQGQRYADIIKGLYNDGYNEKGLALAAADRSFYNVHDLCRQLKGQL